MLGQFGYQINDQVRIGFDWLFINKTTRVQDFHVKVSLGGVMQCWASAAGSVQVGFLNGEMPS